MTQSASWPPTQESTSAVYLVPLPLWVGPKILRTTFLSATRSVSSSLRVTVQVSLLYIKIGLIIFIYPDLCIAAQQLEHQHLVQGGTTTEGVVNPDIDFLFSCVCIRVSAYQIIESNGPFERNIYHVQLFALCPVFA